MKISVVVPAFNEEKLIGASLASIRNSMEVFASAGTESELIVCDNNSTDRTAELARTAGATVVFEPVNQIARARNRGAESATGDWLIFVDADSHPSCELFADVHAVILSGKYVFGGCTIEYDAFPPLWSAGAWAWNQISRVFKYSAGSFIFCETAAFRKVGGFDIRFFAAEEIDLSRRLKRLGKATGKRAVILHRHPLLTSARKLHLYSTRELTWFLAKSIFRWRRTVTDQSACHPWYDGRR